MLPLKASFNTRSTRALGPWLKFGCRMMAFAAEGKGSPEQDTFRRNCLMEAEGSLKKLSQPEYYPNDGTTKPYQVEDLSGAMRKKGNLDGWGLAGYEKSFTRPWTRRNTEPAFKDPQYDQAVEAAEKKRFPFLLAHIRAGSDEKSCTMENTHPFLCGNWSFIHNGYVDGARSEAVKSLLKGKYRDLLGDAPKGTTDSEAVFYYFLGKLKEKYGTVDSQQLGLEKVRQVFAESIQDLIRFSNPMVKKLDGRIMGLGGKLDVAPSCNFILSDGENLLAFRRGAMLFLGMQPLPNGEKEFILSSDRVHPRKISPIVRWIGELGEKLGLKAETAQKLVRTLDRVVESIEQMINTLTGRPNSAIEWLPIPENYLLVMHRDAEGRIQRELMPLEEAVKAS